VEKINWTPLLIGFAFSIAAVLVANMITHRKNYNTQGQLTGYSKPGINMPNKKNKQMRVA
jgi:hypothetical protein